MIIQWDGQLIGLAVDRIADVITIPPDEITPPPGNVNGADGRCFRGVYTTETQIIVILKIDEQFNSQNN